MSNTTWTLLTPPSNGAIAIVQLAGDVQHALQQLTGKATWNVGELRLVEIPQIDEAVAVQLNENLAHVMPHGSVHIVRKLAARFEELEILHVDEPQFPEAHDEIEEAMLVVLSVAKSPLAVKLLLQQPERIRGAVPNETDLERSAILNHLIIPPKVVLLGMPNTGKSTLMNALTMQDTSLVHALPGATRDAVGARIDCGGLVLDLYDLPGFRESEDIIEQEAIQLAAQIAREATLTILLADSEHAWLPTKRKHIRVATKSDIKMRSDCNFCVSAHTGEGLENLTLAIRDAIVPPNVLEHTGPWFFYNPTEE